MCGVGSAGAASSAEGDNGYHYGLALLVTRWHYTVYGPVGLVWQLRSVRHEDAMCQYSRSYALRQRHGQVCEVDCGDDSKQRRWQLLRA